MLMILCTNLRSKNAMKKALKSPLTCFLSFSTCQRIQIDTKYFFFRFSCDFDITLGISQENVLLQGKIWSSFCIKNYERICFSINVTSCLNILNSLIFTSFSCTLTTEKHVPSYHTNTQPKIKQTNTDKSVKSSSKV